MEEWFQACNKSQYKNWIHHITNDFPNIGRCFFEHSPLFPFGSGIFLCTSFPCIFFFVFDVILLLFWYFDAFWLVYFFPLPRISLDLRSQIYLNASTIVDEQYLYNNDDNSSFVYFHSLSCTVIFLFSILKSNFRVPCEWFCCIIVLVCHMQLWKLNQINVKVTLTGLQVQLQQWLN